jgi:hypothetical protein
MAGRGPAGSVGCGICIAGSVVRCNSMRSAFTVPE